MMVERVNILTFQDKVLCEILTQNTMIKSVFFRSKLL